MELRRELEDPFEPAITPRTGWRVLKRTDDLALYGAGEPPEIIYMALEREDGEWAWAGQGQCKVRVWVEGGEAAEWEIDPDAPPMPDDRTLRVLLSELACTSGADPRPRLEEPQISYAEQSVTIALFVRYIDAAPGEFFTCIGVPPVPTKIELDQPLGERELLDGGIYPPQKPHLSQ